MLVYPQLPCLVKVIHLICMSNNASSDSDASRKPDNPQETLNEENWYYAGFFAAEMSCSVIKAANYNPVGHYYFAIDITVSNADRTLLEKINTIVMQNSGVISAIKGGFNLSARGKRRVRQVLNFFDQYPILAGDLARNRLDLMREALSYLEVHRGSSKHQAKSQAMDEIRKKLRSIKENGVSFHSYSPESTDKDLIGHFLAGVLDGDGSFGMKKSENRQQPFLAIAMKDRKIIQLLRDFIQYGNVRKRKDGVFHYEINHSKILQDVCSTFLTQYPLRHAGQRKRLQHLQRILNDYTRNSEQVHKVLTEMI